MESINKNKRNYILKLILLSFLLGSCEKFYEPEQGTVVETDKFFIEWNEYRAAETAYQVTFAMENAVFWIQIVCFSI